MKVPFQPLPEVSPLSSTGSTGERIQASPAAFGAGIGQATQQLGDTIGRAANDQFAQVIERQTLQNETNAYDVYNNQFSPGARKILFDPVNPAVPGSGGFYSKQGVNAVNALGPTTEALDQLRQTSRASLGNPAAQRMFDQMSTRRVQLEMDGVSRHADQQNAVYQKETSDGLIKDFTLDAGTNWNNPDRFKLSLNSALTEAATFGQKTGQPPEMIEAHQRAIEASMRAARINAAIPFDPKGAMRMLGDDSDKLTPTDRIEIFRRIEPVARSLQAQGDGVFQLSRPRVGLQADAAPDFALTGANGMVEPGNIDPWHRKVLQNADGSYSTTSSISVGTAKGETIIPTVVDGVRLTNEEAIAHFKKTGEHLGVFSSVEAAEDFSQKLHDAQARLYDQHGNRLARTVPLTAAISAAATKHGVDPDALARVAGIESDFGRAPDRAGSKIKGPFQFSPETAAQYGLTDPSDPAASADAAARLMADNQATLTKSLGREVKPDELYLAHQQGAKGAAALIQNPTKTAIAALSDAGVADARGHILANGGTETMTAAAFVDTWRASYSRQPGLAGNSDAPPGDIGGQFAMSTAKSALKLDRAQIIANIQRDYADDPPRMKAAIAYVDDYFKPIDMAASAFAADSAERDRQAAKTLKTASDLASKDVFAAHADGSLTRDFIEQRRAVLSPTEYEGALKMLTSKDAAIKDDRDTLASILPRMDTEDLSGELTRELKLGHLSSETYKSLMTQNRSVLKDDQPASPYKSGRELVKTTLDPGQLLTGAAANIARAGLGQALVEFDGWAQQNQKSSRAEHIAQAQDVIKRYQILNYEQLSIATGLPRGYSGTRQDISVDDLDAAERLTLNQLDSGKLAKDQADQELRKLETWRGILQSKPPKPAAK